MKKFEFPLEAALSLRRRRLENEEAQLIRLFRELEDIESARRQLNAEVKREQERVLDMRVVDPSTDIQPLDRYRIYARETNERLRLQIADCQKRIDLERARVVEARQAVEVIDRLKHKRLAQWEREAGKEMEALASECFLAKWARERKDS